MIHARYLNTGGTEKFQAFLSDWHDTGNRPADPGLNSDQFSVEIDPGNSQCVIDESKIFSDRMDLGSYILDIARNKCRIDFKDGEKLIGFFNWISYIYIDQLSQKGEQIIRRNVDTGFPQYVYLQDFRRIYRHIVSTSVMIYHYYGSPLARIFLYSPVYEHNDLIEQTISRQRTYLNKGYVEALHILYWDGTRGKPKRGATSRDRPGTLRRFLTVTDQLSLTYYLAGMDGPSIISLLPEEFERWNS